MRIPLDLDYLWCKLISHKASSVWISVLNVILILIFAGRLGNLKQSGLRVKISDLEPGEVNTIHIVLRSTEVVLGDVGVFQD